MNSNFIRVVNSSTDPCKICGSGSVLFDVVDFHGNIDLDPDRAEQRRRVFPVSGIPIYYWKCASCGLIYTRAFDGFGPADFRERLYDRDWREHLLGDVRQRGDHIADIVAELFRPVPGVSGLDYGGGEGYLCEALTVRGFAFTSFDPFCGADCKPQRPFELITCIEVFEHVADIRALLHDLDCLCAADGGVFFTTALCEGLERCQGWVYCVPRSGHITLFTRASLQRAFAGIRLNYACIGTKWGHTCHFAWRGRPAFAPTPH